jgi:hypothetical protein
MTIGIYEDGKGGRWKGDFRVEGGTRKVRTEEDEEGNEEGEGVEQETYTPSSDSADPSTTHSSHLPPPPGPYRSQYNNNNNNPHHNNNGGYQSQQSQEEEYNRTQFASTSVYPYPPPPPHAPSSHSSTINTPRSFTGTIPSPRHSHPHRPSTSGSGGGSPRRRRPRGGGYGLGYIVTAEEEKQVTKELKDSMYLLSDRYGNGKVEYTIPPNANANASSPSNSFPSSSPPGPGFYSPSINSLSTFLKSPQITMSPQLPWQTEWVQNAKREMM